MLINQVSSVTPFNSVRWLPFYEVKIAKWCVAYKNIKGEVHIIY